MWWWDNKKIYYRSSSRKIRVMEVRFVESLLYHYSDYYRKEMWLKYTNWRNFISCLLLNIIKATSTPEVPFCGNEEASVREFPENKDRKNRKDRQCRDNMPPVPNINLCFFKHLLEHQWYWTEIFIIYECKRGYTRSGPMFASKS